jgi:ssDNA-binding Zn-finger/Zn-ribbon topoisomerase 1
MQMATSRGAGRLTRATIRTGFVIAAVAGFLVLFQGTWASAADKPLSDADKTCLGCHAQERLEKKLANKETLSLHVQADAFAKSVHSVIGCAGCHAEVILKSHPSKTKKITDVREYSIASTEICRGCHADKFKQYEGSIHAFLVRDGNAAAPVCTDCHSPHAVNSKAQYETMAAVPCKNCHVAIFNAYAGSMHGKARNKPGESAAPLCSDCHSAHEVAVASAGEGRKTACLGCHAGALGAHQKWLRNAELHFEVVSCPVCHSPTAKRRVDLRLFNSVAQQDVSEQKGVPTFERRARSADAKGGGLDAIELWNFMKVFNRDGAAGKTTLRGRMEVGSGVEAHQLADKTMAISDCNICHREGAEAFQSVTVSIAGPDGRPVRYGANKEVLNSVISVDSMGGFYAIGATRIKLLDILFLLALASGIAVPVTHLTAKWFFKRYLLKIEAEKAADGAQIREPPSNPAPNPNNGDSPSGGSILK